MALMDASGRDKARLICEQLNFITLDTDLPNKILEEGNLVLDETGMLATKTREGLEDISLMVADLFKQKSELMAQVNREGGQLESNYYEYQRKLRLEREQAEATANTATSDDVV